MKKQVSSNFAGNLAHLRENRSGNPMLPQKKPQKPIGDGQNVATESAPSDQIAAGLMLRYQYATTSAVVGLRQSMRLVGPWATIN